MSEEVFQLLYSLPPWMVRKTKQLEIKGKKREKLLKQHDMFSLLTRKYGFVHEKKLTSISKTNSNFVSKRFFLSFYSIFKVFFLFADNFLLILNFWSISCSVKFYHRKLLKEKRTFKIRFLFHQKAYIIAVHRGITIKKRLSVFKKSGSFFDFVLPYESSLERTRLVFKLMQFFWKSSFLCNGWGLFCSLSSKHIKSCWAKPNENLSAWCNKIWVKTVSFVISVLIIS